MQTRPLGAAGPTVSALGLGAMGMSDMYGPADRTESIATVHAALDAGMTLIDTGDFYGSGHNEILLAEALQGVARDRYQLSVKFGGLRGPDGGFVGYDNRPRSIKNFLTMSLRRLQADHIDIYRPSRLDPEVPIEDVVGTIGEMVQAGYVRHIGLSEVGVDTIRKAAATHPICDLQIEYSVITRGVETAILPACRELGIAITAYGVLARGLISGHWSKDRQAAGRDIRGFNPRFQGENLDRNLGLAETLGQMARARGVTTAQLAIAWVAAQGRDIFPLIGARKRERLAEALGAQAVVLTPGDLVAIEVAIPRGAAAGERYPTAMMAHLDSEK